MLKIFQLANILMRVKPPITRGTAPIEAPKTGEPDNEKMHFKFNHMSHMQFHVYMFWLTCDSFFKADLWFLMENAKICPQYPRGQHLLYPAAC